jgi:hypothetical protein
MTLLLTAIIVAVFLWSPLLRQALLAAALLFVILLAFLAAFVT